MKRMSISMSDELGAKLDKYNEKTLVPKSSIVSLALEQFFQSKEIMENMKDFSPLLEQMKDLAEAVRENKALPIDTKNQHQ